MLKYSFNQLASKSSQITDVDEDVKFDNNFFIRAQDLLIDVKSAHVNGTLAYDAPYVFAQLHVTANVVAPSTRSLKKVDVPIDFKFTEAYTKDHPTEEDFESLGTIIEITSDEIDLQTAVEDNILLNMPIQILTDEEKEHDVMPSGQDWQVISENDYQKSLDDKKVENSPFSKLQNMFDDDQKTD